MLICLSQLSNDLCLPAQTGSLPGATLSSLAPPAFVWEHTGVIQPHTPTIRELLENPRALISPSYALFCTKMTAFLEGFSGVHFLLL